MKLFWNVILFAALQLGAAEVRWADGTVAEAPPGKLLSDNLGYYGDVAWTGMTYSYQTPPRAGSGDADDDVARHRGRRLLNGELGDSNGGWRDLNPPLLASGTRVDFSFPVSCRIGEIDLRLPDPGRYQVTLITPEGEAVRPVEVQKETELIRLGGLTFAPTTRLTLGIVREDGADFRFSEFYAWGERLERKTGETGIASYNPGFPASIPGVTNTQVDEKPFQRWQRKLARRFTPLPAAVWAPMPTWDQLSKNPILPEAESCAPTVSVTMVRNEHESVCLALLNTDYRKELHGTVEVSAFTAADGSPAAGISVTPMVFGALPSRDFGTQLTVLLSASNRPGREVLERYCANGITIGEFPKVTLPGAAAVVCWFDLKTAGAAPGKYTATIRGLGAEATLEVEVIDITLADVDRWVNFWDKPFAQYPFQSLDWVENDADARLAIGATVCHRAPPDDDPASFHNVMRRKSDKVVFAIWQGVYGGKLWARSHMNSDWGENGLTEAEKAEIRAEAVGIANYARSRGLDFDHWYFDTSDEPNTRNLPVFGEVMREIRRAVPEAMIFSNPCCWQPVPESPFEPDDKIAAVLRPWYNEVIDISVPATSLLDYAECGKIFTAPRRYRAHYEVVTQRAKSESYDNVNYPRYLVWRGLARDLNGWAMFSYFNVSDGEPWNDLNVEGGAFTLVYPGPNGPVPTRQYMAAREAFEDYLLMALLKQRAPERHAEVLRAWKDEAFEYTELRELIYQYLKESIR